MLKLKELSNFITNNKAKFSLTLILIFYCIFGFCLRWQILDYFYYNSWIARDFDRAFNLFEGLYVPLAGPELNDGGRLPGPFLYVLLAIPLFIQKSFESAAYFNFFLNLFSLAFIFHTIKRHFGFNIASVFLIFISIYLPNINVFGYPLNPSFLFPLISIYIWALLEFFIKKRFNTFPIIFLAVALGTQLHYSIATFYVAPIFLLIIFKQKVPIKYILITLFSLGLVFAPYLLYKFQTFIPTPSIPSSFSTLKFKEIFSLTEIARLFFVKETILRLTYSNGLDAKWLFTDSVVFISYFLFYATLIFWFFKFYLNGIKKYKKEFIIFITFYIPALIYGIAKPFVAHLWYCYIFIFPLFILLSSFINYFLDDIKFPSLKTLWLLCVTCIVLFFTKNTFYEFQEHKNHRLKKDLKSIYRNSNMLFEEIMDQLKISKEGMYKRVFIDYENLSIYSKRQLDFVKRESKLTKNSKTKKTCFYIFDSSFDLGSKGNFIKKNNPRLKYLISDNSIEIKALEKNRVSMIHQGFAKTLDIYVYSPKSLDQNCYTNTQNPFVVDKQTHDLLFKAKSLSGNKAIAAMKNTSKPNLFDQNSNLLLLDEEYIVFNRYMQTPLRVNINIKKEKNDYVVKTKVNMYSYLLGERIQLKDLSLIVTKSSSQNKNSKLLNIVNDQTFIQAMMAHNNYSTQLDWAKTFKIPVSFDLKKNNFEITLLWETEAKNKHKSFFEENKNQTLKVHLKENTKFEPEKPLKWRKTTPFLDFFM